MLVNGRESDGAAVTIALKNGENIIRIETTSIDGSVTDVYVLTVTRGAAASEPTEPDTAEPGEQSPSNPDASGTEGEAPTAFTQKDATQAPHRPRQRGYSGHWQRRVGCDACGAGDRRGWNDDVQPQKARIKNSREPPAPMSDAYPCDPCGHSKPCFVTRFAS